MNNNINYKNVINENIQSTFDMISKYGCSSSIMKTNYQHLDELIKNLEVENKKIFANAFDKKITIDELRLSRKLYYKAYKKALCIEKINKKIWLEGLKNVREN